MKVQSNHERVLKEVGEIFTKNSDKRICVVGFSCIGKSTLVRDLSKGWGDVPPFNCHDHDEIIWSVLPKDEYDKLKSLPQPWCEETLDIWKDWHRRTPVAIKPGQPVFGCEVLDCDLVVYLTLNENEYLERLAKRGKRLESLVRHIPRIEKAVREATVPVIKVDLSL